MRRCQNARASEGETTMMRIRWALAAVSVGLLLAGCGGGGGGGGAAGGGGSGGQPAASDPESLARKAGLTAVYYAYIDYEGKPTDVHETSLLWTDVFTDERAYRVEMQQPDGTWAEVGRVEASAGSGKQLTSRPHGWQPVRVVAMLPGREVLVRTVSQADSLPALPHVDGGLGFVRIPATKHLSGVVSLSLANPGAISGTASLQVGGKTLTFRSTDQGVAWDTRDAPEGLQPYGLQRPIDADRTFYEVGNLTVVNNNPSALAQFQLAGDPWGPEFEAGAKIEILRWDDPLTSAPRLFVDGVEVESPILKGCLGDLECLRQGGQNITGIYVSTRGYASGQHEFLVRLESKGGSRQDLVGFLRIDRPPVLTLSEDPDGVPVTLEVRLKGRLSDDNDGATMQVFIDDQLRTQVGQGDFDLRLDTAALSDGWHQLKLLARDKSGRETWISRQVLRLASDQRAQMLGVDMRMLGASPRTIIARSYRVPAPNLVWLRVGSPVEQRVLPGNELTRSIQYWLATDEALLGVPSDPSSFAATPWYRWDLALGVTEMSVLAGRIVGRPVADGGWLASVEESTPGGAQRLHLMQALSGSHFVFSREADWPGRTNRVWIIEGGLTVLQGAARIAWFSEGDLMISDTATGRSELLEPFNRNYMLRDVTVDANLIAWLRINTAEGGSELMLRSATPGSVAKRLAPAAGQRMGRFGLHSGLLAWTESMDDKTQLYVLRDGKPQLLADKVTELVGTSRGRIVYKDGAGRLVAWTAARGARVVFPDGSAILRDSSLMVEAKGFLYHIPLDALD